MSLPLCTSAGLDTLPNSGLVQKFVLTQPTFILCSSKSGLRYFDFEHKLGILGVDFLN